jgi:hypothetical protein
MTYRYTVSRYYKNGKPRTKVNSVYLETDAGNAAATAADG